MALSSLDASPTDATRQNGNQRPILIGFADALAAPETAWSLLEAGTPVVAFAKRGSRPALRRSRTIKLAEVTSPAEDARQAVADIRALAESGAFQAVMPLDDDSVWLCRAALGDGPPIPVVGPVGDAAELSLNKRLQLDAARSAGFHVPPTRQIDSIDDLMSLDTLPAVLKSVRPIVERDGALVRPNNYVCATRSELAAAARAWGGGEPLLAQPLIFGTGEGLFGISSEAGLHALSAHRRMRMMNPQGSGSSACASAPVDPELVAAAEQMLGAAEWRGMFMLEFLRDKDGTAWFIELNGRPWGSMALARRSGLEYPAWALRKLNDSQFLPTERPFTHERVCRHLGRELVHLLMVLRGPRSEALTEWPSRFSTIKTIFRFDRKQQWYNYRRGDRAVFFDDTLQTVLRVVRRASR
jgi:predicted ATP-grasp superfamily ATP-dependent carboligase